MTAFRSKATVTGDSEQAAAAAFIAIERAGKKVVKKAQSCQSTRRSTCIKNNNILMIQGPQQKSRYIDSVLGGSIDGL